MKNILKQKLDDARLYWQLLDKLDSNTNTGESNLTADEFYGYFKSLNYPEDVSTQADDDIYEYLNENLNNDTMFEKLNNTLDVDEVKNAIRELKTGKAAGHDLIINELYINASEVLAPVLTCLFNNVFQNGYFPSIWTNGIIVPLLKKGSLNNVDNYRGITLLSTLGKLFTRVLNNRLMFWADSHSILMDAQAGFRKGRSTVDNTFILHNIVNVCLNQNQRLYCSFIDFRKAFDYGNRDCLWYKMILKGIRGKIFNIIHSMYQNVKSQVRVNGVLSEQFDCHLGVRQGESLSPFLFSLFVNDMEQELKDKGVNGISIDDLKLYPLLYADDSVIFSSTREGLQMGLDVLHDYCTKWRVIINTDKTKEMIFRKGGILSKDDHWFYGDKRLDIVNTFNYVGIVFSYTGKWSQTQTTLADKAKQAMFKLNRKLYHLYDPQPEFCCELFDRLIAPILMYGSEVWGFHSADAVERVHLNFCKKVLKVKKTTTSNIVYGELGRFPLQLQRYFRIIKYWLKIVCHKGNPLVCKMYDSLYKRLNEDENIINWAIFTRNLLFKLGFADVWTAQGVGNTHRFFYIFVNSGYMISLYKAGLEIWRLVQIWNCIDMWKWGFLIVYILMLLPFLNIDMQCVNFSPEITGLQL